MNLTEELLKANTANREKIPAEILLKMDNATNELVNKGIITDVIKIGDKFPMETLMNSKNEKVSLAEIADNTPLVISFYRGGWCPYCNIQLKAIQKALPALKEKGARLVAITPETPDNSLSTQEKNELEFDILSDIDNKLAKELGLVFQLPKAIQDIYNQFGLDITKHNGNSDFELPMPATFVLDKNGKVTYRFVNEDYTKRAEILDILNAL